MYCLDSDIIIEYFKGNTSIKNHFDKIHKSELFITPITLCELYKGAFLSKNVEKNIVIINKLLKTINIIEFDFYACELYGKIYSELKEKGKLTQDFDLIIAAICISNNKILITRNIKHFDKIKVLKIEKW